MASAARHGATRRRDPRLWSRIEIAFSVAMLHFHLVHGQRRKVSIGLPPALGFNSGNRLQSSQKERQRDYVCLDP
jgi:hypothetical protein